MKVDHGFYISGKIFKMKKKIIRIRVTVIFAFSCFIAIKIAVSVEIFCSHKGKC